MSSLFEYGVKAAVLAFLAITTLAVPAQRRRDPLTNQEVDQLREQAQNAEERLKLWIKFTRARLAGLEQTGVDPSAAADRPQRIHELLEDLDEMAGEIDDNMSSYAKDRWDIRKELKEIIELGSEYQMKVRSLKESAEASREAPTYRFVLQDTTEAFHNLADDARELLDQQNQQAKEKDPAKKLRKLERR
ncbi:MAG: hypothetical protein JO041_10180 [Acidobacteria bacterium]|nr:hypothetical protein [Acidobacteriota bacterium]